MLTASYLPLIFIYFSLLQKVVGISIRSAGSVWIKYLAPLLPLPESMATDLAGDLIRSIRHTALVQQQAAWQQIFLLGIRRLGKSCEPKSNLPIFNLRGKNRLHHFIMESTSEMSGKLTQLIIAVPHRYTKLVCQHPYVPRGDQCIVRCQLTWD